MRNQTLGWNKALGELIDNAVGNGATTVTVHLESTRFRVSDDGIGCNDEKFAALASIGWHQEDDVVTNRTSRFGIGAKHAFIWAGGSTKLYSVRDGKSRYQEVDWDNFVDDWDYEPTVEGKAAGHLCRQVRLADHGTVIEQPHHNRQMSESIFKRLLDSLNEQHWAAVEDGCIIRVEFKPKGKKKVRGGPLPGKPLPAYQSSIDDQIELQDGRVIRIAGGILDPAVRISRPGFEYIFGHRVVVPACGLGAGGLDFERVYFRVYLMGDKNDWRVTTNKNGLHDADESAVGQAVYDHCKGVLERSCSEDITQLLDQDFLDQVGDLLTNANRKKAKRRGRTGENRGSKKPTGKGSKHENARATQDEDGNIKAKMDRGRIRVKRAEFDEKESHLAGRAVVKDRIVRVNTLHPFVRCAMEERNKHLLFVVAMSIWSDAWTSCDDNGQSRLTKRATFTEKFSAMLKDMQPDPQPS